MWGTCIKFIIFVQSTSLWYICKYWIKRDFATFIYIYMSSCWKKIFLFISGNVISATEDITCSSPLAPVVSKVVASIDCCWGPSDFSAFEVRSLFLIPGYWAILQYQDPPFTPDLFPSGLSTSEWYFCVVAFSQSTLLEVYWR